MVAGGVADLTGHAKLSHRSLLTLRTSAALPPHNSEPKGGAGTSILSGCQAGGSLQPHLCSMGDGLYGAWMAARDVEHHASSQPWTGPREGLEGSGQVHIPL